MPSLGNRISNPAERRVIKVGNTNTRSGSLGVMVGGTTPPISWFPDAWILPIGTQHHIGSIPIPHPGGWHPILAEDCFQTGISTILSTGHSNALPGQWLLSGAVCDMTYVLHCEVSFLVTCYVLWDSVSVEKAHCDPWIEVLLGTLLIVKANLHSE